MPGSSLLKAENIGALWRSSLIWILLKIIWKRPNMISKAFCSWPKAVSVTEL